MALLGAKKSPIYAVRLAVKTALDTALSGTCSVYDHVEQGESYPYVSLGPAWSSPDGTSTSYGHEVVQQIDAWSNYRGTKEVSDILDTIEQALCDDTDPLTVTGYNVKGIEPTSQIVRDAEDRELWHGWIQLRLHLQQT